MFRVLRLTYKTFGWTAEMIYSLCVMFCAVLFFAVICILHFRLSDRKMNVFYPQVLGTWRLYLFAVKVPTKVNITHSQWNLMCCALKIWAHGNAKQKDSSQSRKAETMFTTVVMLCNDNDSKTYLWSFIYDNMLNAKAWHCWNESYSQ